MAKRDSEQNPAEQNDSGFGTGNEGRMPAGGDDVRGIAGEGEDAFESDDDEDIEDDEEQEGNY